MDIDKLIVVPMLRKHQQAISQWKYEGIYAFYNRTRPLEYDEKDDIRVEDAFVCLDDDSCVAGYFHFGKEAQIPTIENYLYTSDYLDIGLGLRPDLCGQGLGIAFVALGMEYAEHIYKMDKFRLSVAIFNERAIKVYLKAGFSVEEEVTNSYFKNKFFIMTRN